MFLVNLLIAGEIRITVAPMKWIPTSLNVAVASLTLSFVSCEKSKELYQAASDKVKELKEDSGDSESGEVITDVRSVDEAEGQTIILNEKRLVMVEFYTDT